MAPDKKNRGIRGADLIDIEYGWRDAFAACLEQLNKQCY